MHDDAMAAKTTARREAALHTSVSDAWLNDQTSPNTRAAYRLDLDSFGRWCAEHGSVPLTADAAQLVAFQAAREACGDSDSTIRRRWSALTSFYEFAVSTNATKVNPTIGAVRPGVANGDPSPTMRLTPEAIAAYRALATALDPRLDALVSLLVLDGLKMGEALALDVSDISEVSGRPPKMSVTVRRRGETNRVDLDRDTARAVRRCVAQRPAGPLFTSGRATDRGAPRRLTRFGADHLFRRLTIDGTADRVTANALRRFHIATAADSADLDHVRAGAGLADLRSVRRYVEAAAEPGARPTIPAVKQRSTRKLREASPDAAGREPA